MNLTRNWKIVVLDVDAGDELNMKSSGKLLCRLHSFRPSTQRLTFDVLIRVTCASFASNNTSQPCCFHLIVPSLSVLSLHHPALHAPAHHTSLNRAGTSYLADRDLTAYLTNKSILDCSHVLGILRIFYTKADSGSASSCAAPTQTNQECFNL